MILNRTPLSLPEVKHYIKGLEGNPMEDYMKKFSSLDIKKAQELAQAIRDLNNLKVKEEDIVKIIDILPKDSEDLGKIFPSVHLTQEESDAILNLVKNY